MLTIKINKDSFFLLKKKYNLTSETFEERVDQARCILILFDGLTKQELDSINFVDNTVKRQINCNKTTKLPKNKIGKPKKIQKTKRSQLNYEKKYRYITLRKNENTFVINTKKCSFALNKIETTATTLDKAIALRNANLSNNPEFLQAVIEADAGNKFKYYQFVRKRNQMPATGERYIVERNGKYVFRYAKKQKTFDTLESAVSYRNNNI